MKSPSTPPRYLQFRWQYRHCAARGGVRLFPCSLLATGYITGYDEGIMRNFLIGAAAGYLASGLVTIAVWLWVCARAERRRKLRAHLRRARTLGWYLPTKH